MDNETMVDAGESLQNAPEENAERDDTFFLPESATGGKAVKSGDVLQFRVVSNDNGEIEVEPVGEGEGKETSWQDDMRKNVSTGDNGSY